MSYCTTCGATLTADGCPNCGAKAMGGQSVYGGAAAAPAYDTSTGVPVELPMRFVGALIDAAPTLLLSVIGWVPIVGQIIAGIVAGGWWLLRDIKGASLGKTLLKERVVMKDGSEAPQNALIKRNITMAAPSLCLIIPILGLFLCPVVALVCLGLEIFFLATKGERFGDQIAGTKVIKVG